MIVSTVTTEVQKLPYSSFKITGCSNSNIEFFLLENLPVTKERRYCNKVLVHECISAPFEAPTLLEKAEFIATSDPCYSVFEIFKSSNAENGEDATVVLVRNEDDATTSILVQFTELETCCLPLGMTYKLYGFTDEGDKILLSNGRMYVTPCTCGGKCGPDLWVEVGW